MSTHLAPFAFEGQPVRVEVIDGEPWFVAADVAAILGYDHTPSMVRNLDAEDKGVRLVHTLGGAQDMTVISEGALFQCIVQRQTGRMTDDRTRGQVRAFQRWVTHEVLPSIRQSGGYGTPTGLSFEEMTAHVITELSRRIEEAQQRAQALEAPARAWTDLSRAAGDFTVSDAAKALARGGVETGPRKLYDWLEANGWVFRRGGRWQAMQAAVNAGLICERITSGYFDQDTGERRQSDPQVRITAAGLERLLDLMGPATALSVVGDA